MICVDRAETDPSFLSETHILIAKNIIRFCFTEFILFFIIPRISPRNHILSFFKQRHAVSMTHSVSHSLTERHEPTDNFQVQIRHFFGFFQGWIFFTKFAYAYAYAYARCIFYFCSHFFFNFHNFFLITIIQNIITISIGNFALLILELDKCPLEKCSTTQSL